MNSGRDDELGEVEIFDAGYGLHWETLDVDFTVGGLLAGGFGTKAYRPAAPGRRPHLPRQWPLVPMGPRVAGLADNHEDAGRLADRR
ncbi:MAG: DUF2442 domain-containing protein [Loktanella sp.]|nr:DUF2442 domain-containing protein [Loktanella sp.]